MYTRSVKKARSNSSAQPSKNAKKARCRQAPDLLNKLTPVPTTKPSQSKGKKKLHSQASTANLQAEELLSNPWEPTPTYDPVSDPFNEPSLKPHRVEFHIRVYLDELEVGNYIKLININNIFEALTWTSL